MDYIDKLITQIEIGKIILNIIWDIGIFYFGYILGQQKAYTKLLEENLKKVRDIEYTRITKTNNR